MRIAMFYEHISRELGMLKELENALVSTASKHEETVEVGIYSIFFEWTKALRAASACPFDALLMPWIYSINDYHFVEPFRSLNSKLIVINLHHEQIRPKALERLLLPLDEVSRNACHHFAWGSAFDAVLRGSGVNSSLICETGSVRMQLASRKPALISSRDEIAERFSLDSSKPWYLFAEDRGLAISRSDRERDELTSVRGVPKRALRMQETLAARSMNAFVSQLSDLGDSEHDGYEFIYRPHPGTRTGGILPSWVKVIDAESLTFWLPYISALLVQGSTCAFEADCAGIAVIRHQPTDEPEEWQTPGLSRYVQIQSLRELDGDLVHKALRLQRKERIYQDYYGSDLLRASEKCAATIFRLVREDAASLYAPKPKKSWSFSIRHAFFEITSRACYSCGMLERVKWPHTAYRAKNDIPPSWYKDN